MASFTGSDADYQRLDWRLLQNGPVALYFRRAVLDRDLAWLNEHHYDVKEIDCASWSDDSKMFAAIADTLAFPAYFGRNFDALNDCLSDITVRDDGGLVVVFSQFDAFASRERLSAQTLLDIFADSSRRCLLFGRRMLTLVQSDDPRIEFEPVGATGVGWNPAEWMMRDRGVAR